MGLNGSLAPQFWRRFERTARPHIVFSTPQVGENARMDPTQDTATTLRVFVATRRPKGQRVQMCSFLDGVVDLACQAAGRKQYFCHLRPEELDKFRL